MKTNKTTFWVTKLIMEEVEHLTTGVPSDKEIFDSCQKAAKKVLDFLDEKGDNCCSKKRQSKNNISRFKFEKP